MSQCATNAGKKNSGFNGDESENNKKKSICGKWICVAGVFFCVLAYIFFIRVAPIESTFVFELGSVISTDPSEYLEGFGKSVKLATVDMSKVESSYAGTYDFSIKHLARTFKLVAVVQDTLAPEVTLKNESPVCAFYKQYEISDFVESITDACPTVRTLFENSSYDSSVNIIGDGRAVQFTDTGVHSLTINSEDAFGNKALIPVSVLVDTEPFLYGTTEYYVSTGTECDVFKDVWAEDIMDGTLTDKIVSDLDSDYLTISGEYPFKFSVTDSLGLTAELNGIVHSYDALRIQDMVNTEKLDPFAGNVLGVINPYDSGYNIEDSIDLAIRGIAHSVVKIFYSTDTTRTRGSGFIVEIDDNTIIICTNKHVVNDMKTVSVAFYDGTTLQGEVVAGQRSPDIAFVKISKYLLSSKFLRTLKTVHVNLSYYNALSIKPDFKLGMYCINEDGSEWLTNYGKIQRKTGYLSEYFEDYDYPATEVSVPLVRGVSGSAIVDSHGNLVCMATYFWENGEYTEYYGVSLNDILDFYEETFGKRLEYY